MKETKGEEPLAVILRVLGVLDEARIQEALKESSTVGMTLERTLAIKGTLAKSSLSLFAEAARMVESGEMSLDLAIRAARLSNSEGVTLQEAVGKLKKVHRATVTVSSIANELMQMMQDAGLINSQQMQYAIIHGESSGMLPGRVLLLNKAVSARGLEASISACLLLRQKVIEKADVVEALKRAFKKDCCLEQAMFELGTFKQPSSYNMRLSDLLVMSGLISESELLECRELSIAKNKSFKQVVLEQGMVDGVVLDFVTNLQNMVASNALKPFEAARALYRICKKNTSLDRAAQEERNISIESNAGNLLLGQLLVLAETVQQVDLDSVTADSQASNIKIGKILLSKGFINDDILVKSLRTQSAWKHGYIAKQSAVQLLKKAVTNGSSLEMNSKQVGIYLPTHVQWSWV